MKKLLCAVLALAMMMTACLAMAETVEEVIAQAQTMTNEELYARAIEESNGKTLYGIGNPAAARPPARASSRCSEDRPELHRHDRMVAAEEQLHLHHAERRHQERQTTFIP